MVLRHVFPMVQLLPILMTMMMSVFVLGVYAKTVSIYWSYEMPTFCLAKPWAALGMTFRCRILVYSGKRHVLLVKVVHRGLVKP